MQTASFLCHLDTVFKVLQTILKRKGYVILLADEKTGQINATRKKRFFGRNSLHVKIHNITQAATGLKLMINNNTDTFARPVSMGELEEKNLLDAIYNAF